MIIRDPDGVTVLTLGDTAPVGGYLVSEFQQTSRGWRRATTAAARVDGEFEVAKARQQERIQLRVYIEGANVAQVRTRYRALLAAVEVDRWVLDVTGDGATATWVCDAADSEPVFYPDGSREVTLTIPARPGDGY